MNPIWYRLYAESKVGHKWMYLYVTREIPDVQAGFILVHWFLKCQCSLLSSSADHVQFTMIHGSNIPGSYVIFFLQHWTLLSLPDSHSWVPFALWHSLFILSGAISNCPLPFPYSTLDTFWPGGAHLLVSYLFAFSYCSRDPHNKDTGVVCNFLLRWTSFCQNSSRGPVLINL